MHDIGKLAIPEVILFKPDRLTPEEYALVKDHVTVGADLLAEFPTLHNISAFVRYHHERYDGQGYPDGLSGKQIPLEARILALADAVEAMASDRPYRKGMDVAAILSEIVQHAGSQFDPAVVSAFPRVVQREGNRIIVNSARPEAERASGLRSKIPSQAAVTRSSARLNLTSLAGLAILPCLIFVASLLLHTASLSLPGDSLYALERGAEEVQGALISAAGSPLNWHISQVNRRLHEIAALEEAGRAPDPALAQEVISESGEAIAAAAALPASQRDQALAQWAHQLHLRQVIADPDSALADLLAEPLALVESARLGAPPARKCSLRCGARHAAPQIDADPAAPRHDPRPGAAQPSAGDRRRTADRPRRPLAERSLARAAR